MGTSVQNRLHHLEPGFHDLNRNYNKSGYRSDSLPRSCSLPGNQNLFTSSKKSISIDDYSSDEDDFNSDYQEMIEMTNAELQPSVYDPRDKATSDNWIERNPFMVRLTGKHPFNSEAPLPRLMHHGFLTPVPLHYVRNHGAVPHASWDTWTVEICGLVKHPFRFTMDQLVTEFPSRELPVTLVCAGNRRKEQNMTKKSLGFNWGASAISNSVWRGVPLHHILTKCGIFSRKSGALNVCFEGAEDLPGGGGSKYGTSIKKEFAMDPSRDIMVAYMQNGERLAPDHGFPVRIIIPGFIGGRMVKWLKRIIVTTQESDNYYHLKDNKVLPSHVDAELANAEAWWYKPEYSITELNTNSAITTPYHEEVLTINAWTTQTPYTLKGYAYSGGGKKVVRVEVTMDGGESWYQCTMDHQEKPNKYGKHWCWCFWSLDVDMMALLASKEIAVRAWDESHNTQPEKLNWNLMGMMNNCWFRVKTSLRKPQNGEIGIVFEHPVQPGNQSGGWMAREKQLEKSSEANKILKKTLSSPFIINTSGDKIFTMSDLKKHNSVDSSWIAVHGHVYDCTTFLKDHPGGTDSILINAGTDCTEEFEAIHSDKAKQLLEPFRIGELMVTEDSPLSSCNGEVNTKVSELVTTKQSVALVGREKVACKLVQKTSISHDVRLFRFAFPSSDQTLGLPVGKHIFLCATIDGKLCMRAYTPSSSVDEVGYFELVVKIYLKDTNPNFPNGGTMSQYLDSIPIGTELHIKGPIGHIEYLGKGNFYASGKQKFAKNLAMIAGGSGITPIYQVMQAILKDPEDETKMFVVFANRTEDDILLKDEMDAWAEKYKNRVKIWYVIGKKLRDDRKYSVGRISESILREHVPAGCVDTLALACGPPAMIEHAVTPNLDKMGYDTKESLLVF
ncbi:nitrate reductase [NADH] 2-like [Apium graveolens]|uniref:nitrate reductase [NADH] 2-like n=1 Tax=Apium graveolens TaxID=4045 RepID=UPI003D7AB318